jgi:hypothetical protein
MSPTGDALKRSPAAFGVGDGITGRVAAVKATQRALDQLGAARPALALVFAAQEFDIQDVLAGLAAPLGETPLWGFSTTCPLTGSGDQPRAVVVALLTGAENKAQVRWLPNYARESAVAARQFVAALRQDVFLPHEILLAADGINGSLAPVLEALGRLGVRVSGCAAAGDPSLGKTFGIGQNQAGPGGLAALSLGGSLRLGAGLGHGWRDLGVYFQVTRARDGWVQMLDGFPAVEAYARCFGYPAREWSFPPLSNMARLYPLGVEQPPARIATAPSPGETTAPDLLIRSPLRVEVDGSLRMSAPLPEGAVAHLMAGDADACLDAARSAARQALADLGPASPLLAVALVDAAWQALLETRPGQLSTALQSALGQVPLVGAYTFGQLARPAPGAGSILHNQNISVLVIGEAA